MEKIKMSRIDKIKEELEKELNISMQTKEFCDLLKRNKITKDDALKNNTKLMDTVLELKNCQNCKGLINCQNKLSGHVLYPSYDGGFLKFIYMPCRYQKEESQKKLEKLNSINELENIRMKDIDITDKNRVAVIKWLKDFYDKYEKTSSLKGLYLHGSFGSGKTFLISALLNELKVKKHASIMVVYFPEALRKMKEDFSIISDYIKEFQEVDLLLIDDLGAENVTAWGRDEILGTILQYRMNNKMPTFITSNLTIDELERNLSLTKDSVDKVKARRIIERIKQLTSDYELISENRR